ncbi:MAG: Dihydroorotate dehydrogenase [Actinomycetia bacterium]|nr:Dihydroorotate dehydrogenase [Actinomycetes bacterium]
MALDLTTRIGSVTLPNPVLTASGTAGHGAELSAYVDLSTLGAVVVKSLKAEPWAGNAAPRVHEVTAGMINSVGLQGPGVEAWLADELPALVATGARVVASIWGTSVEEYEKAAGMLADAPPQVVAVEVNLSCPNTHASRAMFAHDPVATEEAMAATAGCGRPRWAKLSPNVSDLRPIAEAARRGGAEAVTLVNTVLGMAVDPATRRYRLGSGANGGGVSGAAIHPVAVRAVHDVHAAFPDLPIVGVGGVSDGATAAELLLVGASAVEVGTATFLDPRAPARVLEGLRKWLAQQGEDRVSDVIGSVQA